jgi:hypothetical protein
MRRHCLIIRKRRTKPATKNRTVRISRIIPSPRRRVRCSPVAATVDHVTAISPSPSARARPSGGESGAGRATGGAGGAVSWHGSARATSSSFSLRLRLIDAGLAEFRRPFREALAPLIALFGRCRWIDYFPDRLRGELPSARPPAGFGAVFAGVFTLRPSSTRRRMASERVTVMSYSAAVARANYIEQR